MSQRLLRISVVLDRTGWSRSSLYAKIRAGKFPAPISLGERSVAWPSDAVDQWIADRIQAGWKTDQRRAQSRTDDGQAAQGG